MSTFNLPKLCDGEGIFIDGDWLESKDQDPSGEVRLIQMMDIAPKKFLDKSCRFITMSTAKRLKCTFLKAGDILISRMPDPIGRACIFPDIGQPAVTAVDVCIVRPNLKRVNTPWLVHLINSMNFRYEINKWINGTTRQRISRGNLSKIYFYLPPLPEQKRIAAILDKADAIREKREKAIKLTDSFLSSTFLEMFGDPISNPMNWDKVRLSNMTSKIGSGSTPRGGNNAYKESGINLVRSMNVKNFIFDKKGLAFIDDTQADALRNVTLEKKDVLLNITGASVCRCTVVPDEIIPARVNQHVAIIRTLKDKLAPDFLVHVINSQNFKQNLLNLARKGGATREALTKESIENLEIILPPIKTQQEFIKIVESTQNIYFKQLSSLKILKELNNSLYAEFFNNN